MGSPFGEMLKRLRTEKRITLREFCLTNRFDPGNYSRIERGHFPPPQKPEIIEKYAIALGVQRGSDAWLELFDLAAASRGQLPKDLMDDKELLRKLPVLFRTLRGSAVADDTLDDLVEKIREA
jgi:transcriptional regulator with XRE-family HTH domain